MTTTSRFACLFVAMVAMVATLTVVGSVGAGNGQQQDATRIDPIAMMDSPLVAQMPDLTVAEPF